MSKSWKLLTLSFLTVACAPQRSGDVGGGGRVRITIRKDNIQRQESGLSASGGGSVTLPENLCYAIHVTGEGLERVSASDNLCGNLTGLGFVSDKAYAFGETAELEVKVGAQRHFELIGFASPKGEVNGRAVCGNLTAEFVKGATALATKVEWKIDGQVVTAHPVLFADAMAVIEPGDNTVVLQAIAKVNSTVTAQLVFGAPFLKSDYAIPPPACRVALGANRIYSATGSGVGVPTVVPSTLSGSVRKLTFITATPGIFVRAGAKGSVSSMPSTTGYTELSTGLAEIRDKRDPLD